ncbi:MAG: sigma-70 family RNA polymerase sigma factor, partial [Vicinamibacterales bacterium]
TNTFLSGRRMAARRGEHRSLTGEDDDTFSIFEQLHVPLLLWWGNPEQEFLDKLLREDLERTVDALPEPFRIVLVLADMQGCTYQDIAATLKLPVGTVRSRLARARALVQKGLWRHAQELGLVNTTREQQADSHE